MKLREQACWMAAGLVVFAGNTTALGGYTVEAIALTHTDGPLGPGLEAGVEFYVFPFFTGLDPQSRCFSTPCIDQLGNVAFIGELRDDGDVINAENETGIWKISDTGRVILLREGDAIPGDSGLVIDSIHANDFAQNIYSPVVISEGRVATLPYLRTGAVSDKANAGVFILDENGMVEIARTHTGGPSGFPDAEFTSMYPGDWDYVSHGPRFRLRFADPAAAGFYARVELPDKVLTWGHWIGHEFQLPMATGLVGAPVPGVEGEHFQTVSTALLAPDGRSAFAGHWVGGATYDGVFTNESGETLPVALVGWDAPGVPGAVFKSGMSLGGLNGSDQVLVAASVAGEGVTPDNADGIWLWSGGSLSLVAREGFLLPGHDAILKQFTNLQLNAQGDVSFICNAGAPGKPNLLRVVIVRNGVASIVADQNNPLGESGKYLGYVTRPTMNEKGQVAFGAYYGNPGGGGADQCNAVLASDLDGTVHTVAYVGQPFEVAPGDVREIGSVFFVSESGGEDGRRVSFNNRGELVLKLGFQDSSSGLFKVTIEPFACPGDRNKDGRVDVDDLNMVLGSWNASVRFGDHGDADADGGVDVDDLNIVLGAWNSDCA